MPSAKLSIFRQVIDKLTFTGLLSEFSGARTRLSEILTKIDQNAVEEAEKDGVIRGRVDGAWGEISVASYWERDEVNGYLYPVTLTDKVGLGANTPTARLHTVGSGNTSATFATKIENSDNTNLLSVRDDGLISFRNYTFPTADGDANQVLTTDGLGNLTFATPPTGVWTRDGVNGYLYPSTLTDKVGIGTISPTHHLSIEYTGGTTNDFDDSDNYGIKIRNKQWSSNQISGIEFWNGNVKTVPSSRIAVKIDPDGAQGDAIHFQTQTPSVTNPNPDFPTTKMVIKSDGKVGIGEIAPATELEVNGTITASGLTGLETLSVSRLNTTTQNDFDNYPFTIVNEYWDYGILTGLKFKNGSAKTIAVTSVFGVEMNGAGTAGDDFYWMTQEPGVANPNISTPREVMRLTDGGDLSIGAGTTPTARLHAVGSGSDATTKTVLFENDAGATGLYVSDAGYPVFGYDESEPADSVLELMTFVDWYDTIASAWKRKRKDALGNVTTELLS